LRLRPGDLDTQQNLALAFLGSGKPAVALPLMARVARLRPESAEAEDYLAQILLALGQTASATEHLKSALRLQPDSVTPLNNLAWVLATSPRAEARNGPEAVRLAERACQLDGQKHAPFLATLAAAYAEAGRFQEAIITAGKVHDMALKADDTAAAQAALERVALYRASKPFHETKP